MRRLFLLPVILFSIMILSCNSATDPEIITVTGSIKSSEMGIALTHEHLLVDFIGADSTGYHRWNRDTVMEAVLPYFMEMKKLGVKSYVECTPSYLGRDPILLKKLSRETGIQIITNTGYYGARQNKFIPPEVFEMSPEEIAAIWIEEFENGIESTGIRPGFIKMAVDNNDSLSMEHRLLVKAAAITHKATGLVIASHTGKDGPAFEQLKILKEKGVDPSAFIWVHAHRGTNEGIKKAASLGTWISLDHVEYKESRDQGSKYSIDWYSDRLKMMKEAGLLDRVLISHDAGWYRPGEPGGGKFRGYSDIFLHLIPSLQENGFTEEDINQLMVTNPAKAFAIRDMHN